MPACATLHAARTVRSIHKHAGCQHIGGRQPGGCYAAARMSLTTELKVQALERPVGGPAVPWQVDTAQRLVALHPAAHAWQISDGHRAGGVLLLCIIESLLWGYFMHLML